MSQIFVVFSTTATAEFLVAGIPAAARAVRAISCIQASGAPARCVVATGERWTPSAELSEECKRLAPRLFVTFTSYEASDAAPDAMIVAGELFVGALARSAADDRAGVLPALFEARIVDPTTLSLDAQREQSCLAVLRRASRHLVAATGKAGDGIVSRMFNRPISQLISYFLLQSSSVRPHHASVGTAVIGIAMILSLLLGGQAGLLGGAILFQFASVFDGVDGEIARATHRSSDQGAMLDSLIDAATNLAFVSGVSFNMFMAGDVRAAGAGGAGLAMLAVGLTLIGRRTKASGEPVNFDFIKVHLRRSRFSPALTECLIMLTMRDFFAAAAAVLILLGCTHWALVAFAIVTAGWLIVSTLTLFRTARQSLHWSCGTEALR
ncbi:CDP-alcohol phosphatidyltransferase family protein [Sphingomonadaceae bacterium OTU29THOMA1]|nr:CDP-alcohol phosphatidyltransferase family protein [Sphingomonadaceae bacterium OTU29THOMA1]